jgi:hypothetical protein
MALSIRFSDDKNAILQATRGVSFEDMRGAIENGGLVADIRHPSIKYPHQRMFIVEYKGYAYAIPYVKEHNTQVFLKTIYPSRALTKYYLRGGKHEKK